MYDTDRTIASIDTLATKSITLETLHPGIKSHRLIIYIVARCTGETTLCSITGSASVITHLAYIGSAVQEESGAQTVRAYVGRAHA